MLRYNHKPKNKGIKTRTKKEPRTKYNKGKIKEQTKNQNTKKTQNTKTQKHKP